MSTSMFHSINKILSIAETLFNLSKPNKHNSLVMH